MTTPTSLGNRLHWLEARIPDEKRQRRVISVAGSVREEAIEFARSLGYDGDDDLIIACRIVGGEYIAPYLLSASREPHA